MYKKYLHLDFVQFEKYIHISECTNISFMYILCCTNDPPHKGVDSHTLFPFSLLTLLPHTFSSFTSSLSPLNQFPNQNKGWVLKENNYLVLD